MFITDFFAKVVPKVWQSTITNWQKMRLLYIKLIEGGRL